MIAQHARAHIMMLIGGFFMPNTLGASVYFMQLLFLQNLSTRSNYSCDAVVFASIYRALD